MTTHKRIRPRGFTLVEMLVVMAIIAILAAILLPAIRAAITAAKNNKIAQELSSLHQAVEAYKQKFGDYPPDFSSVRNVNTDLADPNNVVVRHFRKAFPRHTEDLKAYFTTNGVPDPAEALVFWLAMLKNDPRLPLTSTTTERHVFFTFDEARLQNPDSDFYPHYVPKDGKDLPYVYFDSRTYQFTYNSAAAYSSYPISTSTANGVWPYKTSSNSVAPNFANPKTFQIISAGLDGDYGPTTNVQTYTHRVFPDGTNYELGDRDNITNFSEGKILEDHLP